MVFTRKSAKLLFTSGKPRYRRISNPIASLDHLRVQSETLVGKIQMLVRRTFFVEKVSDVRFNSKYYYLKEHEKDNANVPNPNERILYKKRYQTEPRPYAGRNFHL